MSIIQQQAQNNNIQYFVCTSEEAFKKQISCFKKEYKSNIAFDKKDLYKKGFIGLKHDLLNNKVSLCRRVELNHLKANNVIFHFV